MVAPVTLTPKPLSPALFGPFGDVIDTSVKAPFSINNGNTERYDSLSQVQCLGDSPNAVINIFRAQPRSLPMRITMMERHPYGSQSFHPLSGEPYLILVGEAVEHLQPEHLHLFLAQPHQGINYYPNTWHHPILALNKTCDFLVVDRKGKEPNCDEHYFDDNTHIQIDLHTQDAT